MKLALRRGKRSSKRKANLPEAVRNLISSGEMEEARTNLWPKSAGAGINLSSASAAAAREEEGGDPPGSARSAPHARGRQGWRACSALLSSSAAAASTYR
jgi:hypothetical protein